MKFKISSLLILTTAVAIGVFYSAKYFRAQQEQVRQQSRRVLFQTVSDYCSNLDTELRGKLVAIPAIHSQLEGRFPAAPEAVVDGSFLEGGHSGTSTHGEIIEHPDFDYHYHYDWSPLANRPEPQEEFFLRLHSQLDPPGRDKPLVRVDYYNETIGKEIVETIATRLQAEGIDVQTQLLDSPLRPNLR